MTKIIKFIINVILGKLRQWRFNRKKIELQNKISNKKKEADNAEKEAKNAVDDYKSSMDEYKSDS